VLLKLARGGDGATCAGSSSPLSRCSDRLPFSASGPGKTAGRSKRAVLRFFAIRTLGKFLGPPLRRSPALVCDCFLNIRKRALDRPEKLHLSFRLSALVAASHRFCQRAALRHQLLASLFQVCNVIHCRSSRVSRPEHYRTGSATPSPAYAPIRRRLQFVAAYSHAPRFLFAR
jgi:hypothetical protein